MSPATSVFIGVQEGYGVRPDFALYNLFVDLPGHPRGSTVTAATLQEHGLAVPAPLTETASAEAGL